MVNISVLEILASGFSVSGILTFRLSVFRILAFDNSDLEFQSYTQRARYRICIFGSLEKNA